MLVGLGNLGLARRSRFWRHRRTTYTFQWSRDPFGIRRSRLADWYWMYVSVYSSRTMCMGSKKIISGTSCPLSVQFGQCQRPLYGAYPNWDGMNNLLQSWASLVTDFNSHISNLFHLHLRRSQSTRISTILLYPVLLRSPFLCRTRTMSLFSVCPSSTPLLKHSLEVSCDCQVPGYTASSRTTNKHVWTATLAKTRFSTSTAIPPSASTVFLLSAWHIC